MAVALDAPLELHPQVALRPEPFGALAYHYGNRRLVFLKSPDVVAVVRGARRPRHRGRRAVGVRGRRERRWPALRRRARRRSNDSEVVRGR